MVLVLNMGDSLGQGSIALIVDITQIGHAMFTFIALHGLLRMPSSDEISDRLGPGSIAVLSRHVIQNASQLRIE